MNWKQDSVKINRVYAQSRAISFNATIQNIIPPPSLIVYNFDLIYYAKQFFDVYIFLFYKLHKIVLCLVDSVFIIALTNKIFMTLCFFLSK